ncbi:MAG: hypothetical protein V5A47_10935 [Bacteroidales bacterium]
MKNQKQSRNKKFMSNFNLRMMKTNRLLKITLSIAMLFIAVGLFAQPYQPYAEMTGSSGNGITDTVTVSNNVTKYLPYYVEPDATLNNMTGDYNPNNDPESQGIYTSFSWTIPTDATAQYQPDASNDTVPYVELRFDATGSMTLSVEETSDGGCSGTPVTQDIVAVAEPSFEVTTDNDNDTLEICDRPGEAIQVASIADNGVQGGNLKFEVDSVVDNLDVDGNVTGTPSPSSTEYIAISEAGNLGGTDVTVFNHDLVTQNGEITRYSFTFNGINDHISRKSDYLAQGLGASPGDSEFNYYPQTSGGNALVYIVYPTPQTGNIYYVPNNFDQ